MFLLYARLSSKMSSGWRSPSFWKKILSGTRSPGCSFFFIPVLMSALAVGYVWQAILQPHGVSNQLLGAISGHVISIAWLGSTTWTIVAVSVIQGWKWAGLAMIIYLVSLETIDSEILEAATVDGANSFQMFWKAKFPLLALAVTIQCGNCTVGIHERFRRHPGYD